MENIYLHEALALRIVVVSSILLLVISKVIMMLWLFGDNAMIILLMGLSVFLDLRTGYHISAGWRRLKGRSWLLLPDAIINLLLGALSFFYFLLAVSLMGLLSDNPRGPSFPWEFAIPLILALVQLIGSIVIIIFLGKRHAFLT